MRWLTGIFDITAQDLKTFLKLTLAMVVCLVLAMVLFTFSWGTIPAIIFLIIGSILTILIWLAYFPWT